MPDQLTLQTRRLRLRILDDRFAAAVLDYYVRNRNFHQPWFATRSDDVFTLKQQKINLAAEYAEFQAGRAVPFWISLQDDPERIIGRFAFTQMIHGCFDSCYLAYHLDQGCQGGGLAFEAGLAAIPVLFQDFAMHRIEASIMPANHRSIALAERLGFDLEGLSPRFLKINGFWEDHLHYVRLASEPPADQGQLLLETAALQIRILQPADIPAAIEYCQRNQDYLYAWNPAPAADLDSPGGWQRLFAAAQKEQAAGRRLDFGLFLADKPHRLVGTVECRGINPLPFSCCEIGFSVDRLLAGRGLMLEALSQVIAHLLACFALKRITASVCAGHERSIRLLEMLGFCQEGLSRQAIYLQGSWQDVVRLALLQEDFHPVMPGAS